MNKIFSLTKVFVKEFYNNLNIFDKNKKRFNIKNIFFWLCAILFFAITYLSEEIIKFLAEVRSSTNISNYIFWYIIYVFVDTINISMCKYFLFFKRY